MKSYDGMDDRDSAPAPFSRDCSTGGDKTPLRRELSGMSGETYFYSGIVTQSFTFLLQNLF